MAEATYVTGGGQPSEPASSRLVVRRSRLTDPAQRALWPDWRYHAFVTSSTAHRRGRSVPPRPRPVELAIRDLKEGAGLEHCPSGRFFANAAWLACAVLAHNIMRWTDQLGGTRHADQLTVARTIRARLIALPGRVVNRSGRPTLRLPAQWPWADTFHTALDRIRNLPLVT